MSIEELLDLDNEIMGNEFVIYEKDLMIWPLIRWDVLSYLQRIKAKTKSPHAHHSKLTLKNVSYIYYSFKYAPHRLKQKYAICYFCNARGRLNNKNFNTDTDYYTSLFPKILVIDNSYRGKYYIPDNTDNFATGEFGILKAFLLGRIKRTLAIKRNRSIEQFIDFLKTKKSFNAYFINAIRNKIYNIYYGYDYYKSYFIKVFKKLSPQIVFIRGSTYGGYYSILLSLAKENGIITGEFQHGNIYEDHVAYNYGDAIFKSESYKKYLPDYVLTFGDYWNNKIKMPSKKITIGYPHYSESLKKYQKIKPESNTILIISQGTITEKFVEIAKYLAVNLPNYKIVFKLHPGEVPFEERYKELHNYVNVDVVKSGDIYEYIARAEKIVAWNSTAIFEALNFNKELYILDNELSNTVIPKEIGIRFKENEELISKVNTFKSINNLEQYFNPNWKENYRKFLEEEIGLKNSIK